MDKKILFSPIGLTDPISKYRDGSMLHICRIIKPDIVYLYMSKEVLEFHDKDNRYVYCIEKLGEKLNHKFEIHIIERPELVNVQLFDYFYKEFNQVLNDIRENNKDARIYINVSSGTPAMKSELQIISAITEFNFIPLQVSTPQKGANKYKENSDDYAPELQWELNEDNEDNFENRCSRTERKNLLVEMKKKMIEKHIDSYNYVAALSEAETIKDHFDDEVFTLLNIATSRLKLDFSTIDKLNKNNYNIFPIKESNKIHICEYILQLKIKLIKKEYADFIRAISPVLTDIFEILVKKYCKITVNDYCEVKRENGKIKKNDGIVTYKWSKSKINKNDELKEAFEKEFGSEVKETEKSAAQMAAIMKYLCKEQNIIDIVQDLRYAEYQIRNIAAHDIISVTDEWIYNKIKFTSEQLLEKIRKAAINSDIHINDKVWDSYNQMNNIIKEKLGVIVN